MVFGLRALHPPHPLRLQQQQQLHRLPASWHLPLPRAHHCLSCRPWRCRSLVRLLANIPCQAGLPPQSDRTYASSSSCDGKRACTCAPKASAADSRVQKIARPRAGPEAVCLLPAAAATSALCMCPERRQLQSQRVQGWARMQPTDLWATSECRTHRPASKAPLPVRPSRAPERQSATGGAHGAAAGGQAAPPDDLAEGPAPFYRRLHLSPPRHVARVHLALPRRRRRLRLPPLGGSDGPRGLAAAAALPRARLYGQAARWVRFASCAPLVRRPSRRRCRDRCRNRRVAARRRAPAPAAGLSRRAPPGPQKA